MVEHAPEERVTGVRFTSVAPQKAAPEGAVLRATEVNRGRGLGNGSSPHRKTLKTEGF